MKALTIQQPRASLIIVGVKRFEYRTWRTSYRGDLLIHAGKHKPTQDDLEDAADWCKKSIPWAGISGWSTWWVKSAKLA